MIKRPGKQQRTKRILCLVAGFIVLFFILPLLAVKIVYDQQFPRFDRHDDTISTSLRYEDLAARYPRRLVNFPSGPNRLQGYIYGLDNERGLVVVAHGLETAPTATFPRSPILSTRAGGYLPTMPPAASTARENLPGASPKRCWTLMPL